MWYYKSKEYDETPEEYQGFVYLIAELDTNKKYIGKKNFWKPKVLPKNSKRSRTTTDRTKNSNYSLSLKDPITIDETFLDSVKQKVKCHIMKQSSNSKTKSS
jgi:hypothetical protein